MQFFMTKYCSKCIIHDQSPFPFHMRTTFTKKTQWFCDHYGSFTLHGNGNGTRNDGFIYYAMYCSHYTGTGTGTGTGNGDHWVPYQFSRSRSRSQCRSRSRAVWMSHKSLKGTFIAITLQWEFSRVSSFRCLEGSDALCGWKQQDDIQNTTTMVVRATRVTTTRT